MNVRKIEKTTIGVKAPPAKAHTLRAILLASLAEGTSRVRKPLLGDDQLHLIDALRRLGVVIDQTGEELTIKGNGGLFSPLNRELDLGESGVAMNTLAAVASLVPGEVLLGGAAGLVARPVSDLVEGLRQLGCEVEYAKKEGYPPLLVKSSSIPGGTARVSGKKTSQYLSSLALSSPLAQKDVTLLCTDELSERPYFDITLEMMGLFGARAENRDYREVLIPGGQTYRAADITVEGDWSSASFFILAGAITGATVRISGLKRNSRQGDRFFAEYISRMGASVRWDGEVLVVTGARLSPIEQDMGDVPDLVPPLAIACAFARGRSVLTNVGRLRYKECNRLEALKTELAKMGISASYDEDLVIDGNPDAAGGAVIDPWNDHRIAMSFAVAGLAVGGIDVLHPGCVAKSFPDFWERLEAFWN